MSETPRSTKAWLLEEMEFINHGPMEHTINGRMKPELFSVNDETQEIVLKYPLQDWEINGLGTLHGGISSTMMDLTMSIAVFAFSRQTIPPTISMTTNYLRPVAMDGYVLVKARVTSLGKRNATAYCEVIIPASEKIACTAIGTYAIVQKK